MVTELSESRVDDGKLSVLLMPLIVRAVVVDGAAHLNVECLVECLVQ